MSLEGMPVREQQRLTGRLDPKVKADQTTSGASVMVSPTVRPEDYNRRRELMAELATLNARLDRYEQSASKAITPDDERSMGAMQAEAEGVYSLFGRHAPPPGVYQRPNEYRRALLEGLRPCSETWRSASLDSLPDDAIEQICWPQILSEALSYGQSPASVPPGETRVIERMDSGHKVVEFLGGRHFVKQFGQRPRRAVFQSPAAYREMSRDAQLHRLSERGIRP